MCTHNICLHGEIWYLRAYFVDTSRICSYGSVTGNVHNNNNQYLRSHYFSWNESGWIRAFMYMQKANGEIAVMNFKSRNLFRRGAKLFQLSILKMTASTDSKIVQMPRKRHMHRAQLPMTPKRKRQTNHVIMKTRLFKYIENFTSKNWKFSDKKLWYFSHFCSKQIVGTR